MAVSIISGVVSLISISVVVAAGEFCTDHSTSFFDDSETFWCEHGCCGSYYDRHCCLSDEAGMIVGIVIGCLVFIGLVISGIVACCCCLRRNRGRQGQVVTGPGQTTTVQMATVQNPYNPQAPYPTYPTYPAGGYPTMAYPQMQPTVPQGNPNPGFDPPKYSDVVNPQ